MLSLTLNLLQLHETTLEGSTAGAVNQQGANAAVTTDGGMHI